MSWNIIGHSLDDPPSFFDYIAAAVEHGCAEESLWSEIVASSSSDDGLDGQLCKRTLQAGPYTWLVVRIQVTADNKGVPPRDVPLMPEVLNGQMLSGSFRGTVLEVHQQLGPADAIVDVRTSIFRQNQKLLMVLFGGLGLRMLNWRARIAVRRDFPMDGHAVFFNVFGVDSFLKAVIYHWRAHPVKPDKVVISHQIFCSHYAYVPDWAAKGFFWRVAEAERNVLGNMFVGSAANPLREADQSYYTILQVKRCTHGGPLMPFESPGSVIDWKPAETQQFMLVAYMRTLLSLTSSPDFAIYDSMGGRTLVPYQAAMISSQWEAIKTEFFNIFKAQQRVYRKLYRTTAAPKIAGGAQPRFLRSLVTVPHQGEQETPRQDLDPGCVRLTVRNTFIDTFQDGDD